MLGPSSTSTPLFRRGTASLGAMVLCFIVAGCASYKAPQVTPTQPQPGTLSLSANSLQFNTVVVGQTANQTLTLSNTGTAPVQITALSVSNAEFSFTGPSLPRTILPANNLSYTISFSPNGSGGASATLSITSNATNQLPAVSLAGTGEKAFADLVVTPTSINFGNLTVKTTKTQNVTLQNTGDINLTVQGITVAGSGFGYSSLSPGFSLAPNQKVTFQVWFTPAQSGPSSATVSFISSNLSSPGTLSLTGDGTSSSTPPPPAPSPQQHSVHLTWDASASTVIGYIVYRSETSGGSYSPLFGSAINELSYNDTTVSSGTTYYYVVTSVDSSGTQSGYSNQVTAAVP